MVGVAAAPLPGERLRSAAPHRPSVTIGRPRRSPWWWISSSANRAVPGVRRITLAAHRRHGFFPESHKHATGSPPSLCPKAGQPGIGPTRHRRARPHADFARRRSVACDRFSLVVDDPSNGDHFGKRHDGC
jgi:hypothetical protein